MPTDLAPSRISPKYAPTATAESLARQLAQLLTVIGERFATLTPAALEALEHGDTVPAEQLCSDQEFIADAASAVVERFNRDGITAADSTGIMVQALTGVLALDVILDESSPERQARRRAWCISHGFDPDEDVTA